MDCVPMMTWQRVLGLAGLFLCPEQLTHGLWLPCIPIALFLPNHKPLGVRKIGPALLLGPVRSVEALFWFWSQEQGSLILHMRLCVEHGLQRQIDAGLAQGKTSSKLLTLPEPQCLCK